MGPVRILMATHNGAAHLPGQLASFATQNFTDWHLWVGDDRSADGTRDLVAAFARENPAHPVRLIKGRGLGAARNFMDLLTHPDLLPGPVALSDQDDIWLPHRLDRALQAIDAAPAGPVLYGSRTWLADATGAPLRLSRAMPRPPGFANALVQNIIAGNTMVLNAEALALVRRAGWPGELPFHDWWIYLLVTGAGGQVIFDDRPGLHYRQHGGNLLGAHHGVQPRLRRLQQLLGPGYRSWQAQNRAALAARADLLTPKNRAILEDFSRVRPGPARIRSLWKHGIRRQGRLETALFLALAGLGWL